MRYASASEDEAVTVDAHVARVSLAADMRYMIARDKEAKMRRRVLRSAEKSKTR